MPLIDTLTEKFPNLDLTHRDTIHRLADRLGRGNIPADTTNGTAIPNSKGNARPLAKKATASWDETVRYPHSKRVGPYLLGKILGEGSFAKVKEAMHSVVGEKVSFRLDMYIPITQSLIMFSMAYHVKKRKNIYNI